MYFYYKDVKYEVAETSEELKKSPPVISLYLVDSVVITEWAGNKPFKIVPYDREAHKTVVLGETPRTINASLAEHYPKDCVFKTYSKIEDIVAEPVYCKVDVEDMLCHTNQAFLQEILGIVAAPALWDRLQVTAFKIVGHIAPHQIVLKVRVRSITRLRRKRAQH